VVPPPPPDPYKPLPHIIQAHSKRVLATEFAQTDQIVITVGSDKKINFWNVKTGKEIKSISFSIPEVLGARISPDKSTVAVYDSSDIRLVSTISGETLYSLKGNKNLILSADYSPDGKCIASSYDDKTICIWWTANGELRHKFKASSIVHSLVFTPDGSKLITGGSSGRIDYYDVATGKFIKKLGEHHSSKVTNITLRYGGNFLITTTESRELVQWSSFGKKTVMNSSDTRYGVTSFAFTTDGKYLACGCTDNKIRLWNMMTLTLSRTYPAHASNIRAISFSEDGKLVASGSDDGMLIIWERTPN